MMVGTGVHRLGGRGLSALVVAAIASAATVAALRFAPSASAGPAAPCAPGKADAASAQAAARACHGRVEVLGKRSERQQVFANPDGSYTLETSVLPRRVKRADGSWVPVDPSLRKASDGSLVPVAVTHPMRLSGGGSGSLVTMETAGGLVTLSWPGPLSAPRVDGASAVYPDLRPGMDLRVRALPSGLSYTFVVRTRAALADPALRRIPLVVSGPSVRARPEGGAEVVAADGATLLAVSEAVMWDSTGGSSTVDGPGDAARNAAVGMRVAGRELVLEADPKLLADPDLTLPVYIDPQITAPRGRWAYANSDNGSYDNLGGVARVGRNPECCNGVWRGFFEFSIGQVASTHILAASVNTWVAHSYDCNSRPVTLYLANAIPAGVADGGRTDWSQGLAEELNTQNGNGCGAQSMVFPVTGKMQAWANAGWGGVTFGFVTNECCKEYWKKLDVAATNLVVSYNSVPAVPDGLSAAGTSRRVGCEAGIEPRVNTSGGVRLAATVRDNDGGDAVVARFEWQDVTAGTPVTVLPDTPAFAPPHSFETAIPDASLPDGHKILWRVRGYDGIDTSGYSAWCRLVVDNTRPAMPTITAPGLPAYPGTPPPSTVVGSPVTATFAPAAGEGDVVGYYYGVGSVETVPTIWAPAAVDGTATVPVVPVTSGLNKNFLTVVVVDEAGNRSPVPVSAPDAPGTRQFRANAPAGSPHALADATGDGKADLTALVDVGGGNAAVWRWDSTAGPGFGLTNPIVPQDITTTYPLGSTKTIGGDFDGDGLADLAVFAPGSGGVTLTVQRSARNGLFGIQSQSLPGWNLADMKLVAGNFDADPSRRDDIGVFYNDNGDVFTVRMLLANGSPGSPAFAAPAVWYTGGGGLARLKPIAGDFDGDGHVDVAELWQYPSCQTKMWVHYSTGSAFSTGGLLWDSGVNNFCWDRIDPLAADFDGDGRGDLAMFYYYDGCATRLWSLYGTADRSVTWPGSTSIMDSGQWCPGLAVPSAGDFDLDGRADVAAVYRCCGANQLRLYTFTSSGRTFAQVALRWMGGVGPAGVTITPNVLLGASGSASSSAGWGWSLSAATNGLRADAGWSSFSNTGVDHTEWIKLDLGQAQTINRIHLYPRGDVPYDGTDFPVDFTIEVFDGQAWSVVVSRTGYPRPDRNAVQVFTFPARSATSVRITGTSVRLMAFAEVEAYQV